MGVIDRQIWDNRASDPEAIERELRGDKGRGWLMRWLPSRAHDNGLFLVFSNGVGVDDDEIRTGNAMILDPTGASLPRPGRRETTWWWQSWTLRYFENLPAVSGSARGVRNFTRC